MAGSAEVGLPVPLTWRRFALIVVVAALSPPIAALMLGIVGGMFGMLTEGPGIFLALLAIVLRGGGGIAFAVAWISVLVVTLLLERRHDQFAKYYLAAIFLTLATTTAAIP